MSDLLPETICSLEEKNHKTVNINGKEIVFLTRFAKENFYLYFLDWFLDFYYILFILEKKKKLPFVTGNHNIYFIIHFIIYFIKSRTKLEVKLLISFGLYIYILYIFFQTFFSFFINKQNVPSLQNCSYEARRKIISLILNKVFKT